jgi:hypothetical protein
MKSFDCKACKVSADRSIFLTRLFKKLTRGGKEQSSAAMITALDMTTARFPTPGNTWDYLASFTLEDGRPVQLNTTEEQYHALKTGSTGVLTWEGDTFLSFEPME